MCGADGIYALLTVCVQVFMRAFVYAGLLARARVCTRARVNMRASLSASGFVCTRGPRRACVKSLSLQSLGVNDVFGCGQ